MDKMPIIFIGHGSPMNAIEDNEFTQNWSKIASMIPKPKAILSISAHWYTQGTRIMDEIHPKMIYDMYGFPEELYEIEYNAQGAPDLALYTKSLISREVKIDNTWGYDHGTWSVLHVMYPNADIPVYQLSVDRNAAAEVHYEIGKQIKMLREQGVLILGSGNVVHNLGRVNFSATEGYDWAKNFDNYIKDKILKKEYEDVVNYRKAGESAGLAVPTPEHFYPLLYVLGGLNENDKVSIYNNSCFAGSLSMTSYLFE
jgi:4,5-DOPA dioxygenase extradiol